jgi:Transposase
LQEGTAPHAGLLRDLLRYNLKTVRAYLLKEAFQQLWDYNSPAWAGKFLDNWCRQVMSGVGVANNPQGTLGPPSNVPDPWTMEQELQDRSLLEGKITQPVAGYLYFPKLKKAKNAAYQITYYGMNRKLTLVVQPAK